MAREMVAGDAAVRRLPSLFMTETRLMAAVDSLSGLDPDGEFTAPEAQAYLEAYGSPDAAIERRNELWAFMTLGARLVQSKRELAKQMEADAEKLEQRIARGQGVVLRLMKKLGLNSISCDFGALVRKHGRGRVEVAFEDQIPDDFWRIAEDDDLRALVRMREMLDELAAGSELIAEADALLAAARARRRAVDKKKIQDEWRSRGVAEESLAYPGHAPEPCEVPPSVPGVVKVVDVSLVVK
jgi:hypothetical protein